MREDRAMPDLLAVGKALAAPARVAMVSAMMDGQWHAAGALRGGAGISAAAASEHLAVLVDTGLAVVERVGRSRRFRIADWQVAAALEAFGGEPARPASLRGSRERRRLALARTCYDHLAGRLGVAVADGLAERGWVSADASTVTPAGEQGLRGWGIDVAALRLHRRPVLRPCLDWTEQRPHLAGSLGAAIARHAFAERWVTRRPDSRGLVLTELGAATMDRLREAAAAPAR